MEIRYPGLAPTPEQLAKIQEAIRASGREDDDDNQSGVTVTVRDELWSGDSDAAPHLKHRVTQLIRSLHWKHQKKILDHVEALLASDRQWIVVRRIIFDIQKQQEYEMTTHVGRMIAQEFLTENDNGRGSESDRRSDAGATPGTTVGAGTGVLASE